MTNFNLKEFVLDVTNGGFLFYKFVFPNLQVFANGRTKNVINHIRGERNASLSIYQARSGIWYFKDHGHPDYKGDIFKLYSLIHNIPIERNFVKIMKGILIELEIDVPRQISNSIPQLKDGEEYRINIKDFQDINQYEKAWLDEFGISISAMKVLKVFFLYDYTFYSFNHKKCFNIKSRNEDFIIAHQFDRCVKIYRPNDAEYKFSFLGNKTLDYIIGLEAIRKFLIT